MKLTVVIVSYNVKYYLEQCLYALRKSLQGIEAQVYVVDNCSADGSISYLAPLFPDVHFIQNTHNDGFARANNMAIRQSQSEYVLLLNPDTMVAEHTIGSVLDFMDHHPRAGALGIKMLNTDGSAAKESRRGIPSPMTALYKMCGLCDRFPHSRRLAHYYMSYLPWDRPSKIEIVSGAFCLLRRQALDEAGLLDEDFFMYGEDIDLSYRIYHCGWDIWYHPAQMLHYKGESTQKTSFRYVHVFYEAMLIFFQKHYAHLSLILSIPIRLAIYAKAFSALLHIQTGRLYGNVKQERLGLRPDVSQLIVTCPEHRETCEQLAMRHGLTVSYATQLDSVDLPSLDRQGHWTIIFDLEAYSCDQIFTFFSATTHPRVKIGFLNPSSHTIITEDSTYTDDLPTLHHA